MNRRFLFLILVLAFGAVGVFAQTPAPAPTINIPVDDIFTQMNSWIVTIGPIFAIGIGISLAFAVLGFIGRVLIKAFQGAGGGGS